MVRHNQLADVVHQRGEAQSLQPRRHEVELLADVPRVGRNALGVSGRVVVLALERTDQHVHGLFVRLLDPDVRREYLTGDQDWHDEHQNSGRADTEIEAPEEEAEDRERQRLNRAWRKRADHIAQGLSAQHERRCEDEPEDEHAHGGCRNRGEQHWERAKRNLARKQQEELRRSHDTENPARSVQRQGRPGVASQGVGIARARQADEPRDPISAHRDGTRRQLPITP